MSNERFKKPTDKQLVDVAVMFNNGKIDKEKLTDMVAMGEFIINRLYENGDILVPSSIENEPEEKVKLKAFLIGDENEWVAAPTEEEAVAFYKEHTGVVPVAEEYDIEEVAAERWPTYMMYDEENGKEYSLAELMSGVVETGWI